LRLVPTQCRACAQRASVADPLKGEANLRISVHGEPPLSANGGLDKAKGFRAPVKVAANKRTEESVCFWAIPAINISHRLE